MIVVCLLLSVISQSLSVITVEADRLIRSTPIYEPLRLWAGSWPVAARPWGITCRPELAVTLEYFIYYIKCLTHRIFPTTFTFIAVWVDRGISQRLSSLNITFQLIIPPTYLFGRLPYRVWIILQSFTLRTCRLVFFIPFKLSLY